MLRQLDLTDLIESSREGVLSASVDVDPTKPEHQHDPPAYLIWLRHALKETWRAFPGTRAWRARTSRSAWSSSSNAKRPAGRGVAIYAARDLWRVHVLPVPLPNRIRYGRPDVLPVLWAIDEYELPCWARWTRNWGAFPPRRSPR